MKKIIYIFALAIFTLNSCGGYEIKPLKDCYWGNNASIAFKTLSLKYPVKSEEVNIDDDISYFNIKGREGELEYQDWMKVINNKVFKKDQMLNFKDVFKYNTAFSEKYKGYENESEVSISYESLSCSYHTKSNTAVYKNDNNNDFEYQASSYPFTNLLERQWGIIVNTSDDLKRSNETTATITVKFGPLYDKVNRKMGIITWSKKLENKVYNNYENTFEATGTFKITEVAEKSIYIGNKFQIERF